jgi:hypothetical protein
MIPKPNFETYRIIIDSLSDGALPDEVSTLINIPEPIEKYQIPHAIASFVESELKTRILTPEEREQAWIEDKSSYHKGLADAWEAARKIVMYEADGGLRAEETEKIFGTLLCGNIFKDFEASEAIAKIKAYEEKQDKIKVGDEVFMNFAPNVIGIVTHIHSDGGSHIMWDDGTAGEYNITNCEKTGRHFPQIEKLLKAMKEK